MATYDDLLSFAKSLDGQRLLTLSKRRPFRVRVDGDQLVFSPEGRPERGTTTRKIAESMLGRHNDTGSLRPGDYAQDSFNASYFLALLNLFNAQE